MRNTKPQTLQRMLKNNYASMKQATGERFEDSQGFNNSGGTKFTGSKKRDKEEILLYKEREFKKLR